MAEPLEEIPVLATDLERLRSVLGTVASWSFTLDLADQYRNLENSVSKSRLTRELENWEQRIYAYIKDSEEEETNDDVE